MTDVLTWTVQQRLELEGRAELLRKELSGIESQLARLEAAEVVFGQWAEATDGGRRSSGIVEPEPEPERVVAGPGAGGMRLVPDRSEGMGVESLTPEYRRIMEIVAGAEGPVMAKDVAGMLGRELTPGKVEPVRGQLRKPAGARSVPGPRRSSCSPCSVTTSVLPTWPAATRSPPPPCAAG